MDEEDLGRSEGLEEVVEILNEPVLVKGEEVPGRVTVEKEGVFGEDLGEASVPGLDK